MPRLADAPCALLRCAIGSKPWLKLQVGPKLDRFRDASAGALDVDGTRFQRVESKRSGRSGSSSRSQPCRDPRDPPALLALPLRQLASYTPSTRRPPQGGLRPVPAVARSARWTTTSEKPASAKTCRQLPPPLPTPPITRRVRTGGSRCRTAVPPLPDRSETPVPARPDSSRDCPNRAMSDPAVATSLPPGVPARRAGTCSPDRERSGSSADTPSFPRFSSAGW